MSAAARLVAAAFLFLTISWQAAEGALATSEPAPRRSTEASDPAAVLSRVQGTLGEMATSERPVSEDVSTLTAALVAARGRAIPASALATLSADLAAALAESGIDPDSVERLAQNLFALVHAKALTGREGALLVLDVSTLLADGGVEGPAAIEVVNDIRAICPDAIDQLEGVTARTTRPAVLTRR